MRSIVYDSCEYTGFEREGRRSAGDALPRLHRQWTWNLGPLPTPQGQVGAEQLTWVSFQAVVAPQDCQ